MNLKRIDPKHVRRPLFGRQGHKVIAFICGWEMLALAPGSPIPTVSATVRSRPAFGWVLLAMLAHHWFVELNITVDGEGELHMQAGNVDLHLTREVN